ncbi:aldo/keto reductase [[Clostridium] sordellii]|uniref:aldo/keto reductase n=1 Tax=Paraclostridium sordellii TaxID=1505 RepID=UPI0005DEDFAD|nr:aldo/keto reductase [Paeniclostridium sordellii]CEQ08918.1 aldo/keto reductase [[Clostridium] sordellii] [Paeniclostridium sordellii]
MNYKSNKLGLHNIGLGCGSMVKFNNKSENIATIHEALDNGINILNTADFYGSGISEMIIGEALKGKKREDAFISSKTGALVDPSGQMYGLDVDPFHIKNQLAQTLKRLNLDYIDLYQPARIDLEIPVEETIGAISDLVKQGYVKHIGITQVDADTLRRAHKVHPISFIEIDYSLFNRSAEDELIPTARELGVEIVAFGSLAHGLLSGSYTKEHAKKYASRVPMFSDENIGKNLELVERLRPIADEKGITIAQLSLAWVLSKGNDILGLVGASRRATLLDSIKAKDVVLSKEDIKNIEKAIPREEVAGTSFPTPKFRNGRVQW